MKKIRQSLYFLGIILIIIIGSGFIWSIFPKNNSYLNVLPIKKESKFGISIGTSIFSLNQSQLDGQLDDMTSLGIGWLRFDMDWSLVQPRNESDFNWTNIDRVVASANAHQIKLLPILDNTPGWARNNDCYSAHCPPVDPAQFASFARAVVERYSSQGIHTWEIWNEPNLRSFWTSGPDSGAYAELLKTVYPVIKEVDSGATVISGGTGPANSARGDIPPVDFLTQLYDDGAGGSFDAVGFHPYSYPVMPSDVAKVNAWPTSQNLRKIMIANGDTSKQIWLTEFGAPTDGPGNIANVDDYNLGAGPDHVSEDLQALILGDSIKLVKDYSWAGPLFLYSYRDLGTSQNTNENFFGIIHRDGSPKPAYQTIKQLLTE